MQKQKFDYNPYIPSGCAVSGILDRSQERFSGHDIINSIAIMHERSNGLGGGFAAYGIYPEYKDFYAFHLFYETESARETTEDYIKQHFKIIDSHIIPTRRLTVITDRPLIWRYFLELQPEIQKRFYDLTEEDIITSIVMEMNLKLKGAFVVSSGKNMGVFKGVGYPEDIGEFYKLDEYKAYMWITHGRFPTNTPGWWGGAHPFSLLDWALVHNGEISSFGINKRYLEGFGYHCTLQTDSEAILYIFDLLLRKHKLPLHLAAKTIAAPFWKEIERMPEKEKELYKSLRIVYGSLLVNGPFSVILGFKNGIIGINDRIKLRPLTVAEKGEKVYLSSEECSIHEICPDPEDVWNPKGGEPVLYRVRGDK